MKFLSLIFVFVAVLWKAQAAADASKSRSQVFADLNYALAQTKHKLADLTLEQKTNDAEKAALQQRAATLRAQHPNLDGEIAQLKSDVQATAAEQQQYANSGCPTNGGSVDDPTYSRCEPWVQKINNEVDSESARATTLKQAKDDRDSLTSDTLTWFANKKSISNQIDTMNGVLKALDSRLNFACPGLRSDVPLETLKHTCGNVQFDRARQDLPPCTDRACLEFDALIGRGG